MSDAIAESPAELEAWYDAEIAPRLLAMGKDCADRGITFLAVVGYDGAKGSSGRTYCAPANAPHFFRVMDVAARCWEPGGYFNLDRFAIALARDAHGKSHSSLVLKLMGVPESPAGEAGS